MFRRILVAGFFSALVICLLLELGAWQMRRLHWKQDLIARISEGLKQPARALDANTREFDHVYVNEGLIDTKPPLYVYGRVRDGVPGVEVIALADEPLATLFVDRGFVPFPIDPKQTTATQTEKRIEGLWRNAGRKHWYDAKNDPDKNQWYWMDLTGMGHALKREKIVDGYIEMLPPGVPGGPLPMGNKILENLPNNHLQYAITWYAMAAMWLAMYIAWARVQMKKGTDEHE